MPMRDYLVTVKASRLARWSDQTLMIRDLMADLHSTREGGDVRKTAEWRVLLETIAKLDDDVFQASNEGGGQMRAEEDEE